LWLRSGSDSNPMVQKLTLDEIGEVPRYCPSTVQVAQTSVFDVQTPLNGIDLMIPDTYRHQHFLLSPPENGASGLAMLAIDSLGRAVPDAQVFAIAPSGPRGRAVGQFLGFTSANGVISLEPVAQGGDVVVVAPDGSTAFVATPQQAVIALTVPVLTPGRVIVAPSLRPTGNNSDTYLTIRFERINAPLPGVNSPAYRFASEATGWEVGGLPPDTYRVTVGNTQRLLYVPQVGFAELF
jgi:hypothetical protein